MTVKEKLLSIQNQNICVHCPEKWQADLIGKVQYELDQNYPKYEYQNPWYHCGTQTCITAKDYGNYSVYDYFDFEILEFNKFMEDAKIENTCCL
jgi:hypothetical protein